MNTQRTLMSSIACCALTVASASAAAQSVTENTVMAEHDVRPAQDAVQTPGAFSVPTTSVVFGQGGGDGSITGRFAWQSSANLNIALDATAADRDKDGTADIFSSSSGLQSGGSLALAFTYAPVLFNAPLQATFQHACEAWQIRHRNDPSAQGGATGTADASSVAIGSTGRPPCIDSHFSQAEQLQLQNSRREYLGGPWFFQGRIGVNHTAIRYLNIANSLQTVSDSYTGVTAQIGMARFIAGATLVAASFTYEASGTAPSKTSVCRNLPVGGMTTSPATLQCSDTYTTGLTRSRTMGLRVELRHYLTRWLSINPAAMLSGALVGEDSHLRVEHVDFEAPLFFRLGVGTENTLHLGVRPVVRFWAIDDRPSGVDATEMLVSVFLGGSMPLRIL